MIYWISILPLVLISTSIIVGFYLARDRVFEYAKLSRNKKVFSSEGKLAPRGRFSVSSGENLKILPNSVLKECILDLAEYTKVFSPDWIMGVHTGGRLLSVLLAEEVGHPRGACGYIGTKSTRSKRITIETHNRNSNRPLEGKVLIVDDISRTGNTLDCVKSHLEHINFSTFFDEEQGKSVAILDSVKFAVLVVVDDSDERDLKFRPDWVRYKTAEDFFKLPWSELSAKIESAYKSRSSGYEYDSDAIETHENIIKDYDFALNCARKYV
jgi:hypoxanthine phosphoribosyltransferase